MDHKASSDASPWLVVAGSRSMMVGLTRGSLTLSDVEGDNVLFLFNAGYQALLMRLRDFSQWQIHQVSVEELEPLCRNLLPILVRAFQQRRVLHSLQEMPDNGIRWVVADHLFMAHGLKPGAPVEDDRDWYASNLTARAMEANPGPRVHDRASYDRYI